MITIREDGIFQCDCVQKDNEAKAVVIFKVTQEDSNMITLECASCKTLAHYDAKRQKITKQYTYDDGMLKETASEAEKLPCPRCKSELISCDAVGESACMECPKCGIKLTEGENATKKKKTNRI